VDYNVVNYVGLVPVLLKGIQELNDKVNDLQSQLDGCCGLGRAEGNNNSNQQTIDLKSAHINSLGQSVPNPHKDQCSIPYYIDETAGSAQIIFTDEMGRVVNNVDVIGRGNGQLTVFSSQLADGVYSYSLVVDGKVVDTKKMVKAA